MLASTLNAIRARRDLGPFLTVLSSRSRSSALNREIIFLTILRGQNRQSRILFRDGCSVDRLRRNGVCSVGWNESNLTTTTMPRRSCTMARCLSSVIACSSFPCILSTGLAKCSTRWSTGCMKKAGGASGHETDKITPSSPPSLQHVAKGINPEDGGADMVYFEQDKGAVFSVGSITWVCSLFPDKHVSRITRNVIERFLE